MMRWLCCETTAISTAKKLLSANDTAALERDCVNSYFGFALTNLKGLAKDL